MDIASILGILVATASVTFAVLAGGGSVDAFLDLPSFVCVVGGCLAALLICFPLSTVTQFGRILRTALFESPPDVPALIGTLVGLAETARREGLLALESRVVELDDPFLVLGVQMAVDGTRPEVIEEVLRSEMNAVALRHQAGKNMFDQLGKYGPAFGMIGTLLGLVMMLGNMTNPDTIGPGMAVALLTTLYGALLANALFLPLAEKLNYLNKQELLARDIIVRGIMAIQSGDNPRIVQQRLGTYLPFDRRNELNRAA